ncbi:CBS domain-containing protein [Desulfobulbus rhabdoformis]|uniref:CBS domain-containing protein n=1 Tax=Desulfobulbus rhabdoformis TaxID=34032 RepID=UPI00196341D1|nr:CBS domain-containing protein [Desulfobulbus rhabdoformis]MBM9614849.1 CBS domain-containing protein [Desulfobulbus rhabdoformis]
MSQNEKTIAGLIIPLEQYPHIQESASLEEAIIQFKEFLPDGHERVAHNQLLVINDKDQLVGRLTLMDIMRGFAPQLFGKTKVEHFDGKTGDFTDLALLLEESTFSECGKNRSKPILPLVQPIKLTLSRETHLLKALVMMSAHNELNVPVTENGRVIGVLRLEEIFLAMCNTYCVLPQANS